MAKITWPGGFSPYVSALARYEKLIGLVFILALVAGLKFWPHASLAELTAQAESAYQKQDFQTAFDKLQTASALSPSTYSIHLSLAKVYEAVFDYDQALSETEVAYSLAPVLGLKGEIERLTRLRGEPASLRSLLASTSATLTRHPDFRDAWVRAAYLNYRLQDFAAAKKALTRALEIDPNYEPTLKLKALLP